MAIEIELKVKVDSFDQIAEKLRQIGADFDDDYRQTDYYFDDEEDSLVDSDRCLRLRKQHPLDQAAGIVVAAFGHRPLRKLDSSRRRRRDGRQGHNLGFLLV